MSKGSTKQSDLLSRHCIRSESVTQCSPPHTAPALSHPRDPDHRFPAAVSQLCYFQLITCSLSGTYHLRQMSITVIIIYFCRADSHTLTSASMSNAQQTTRIRVEQRNSLFCNNGVARHCSLDKYITKRSDHGFSRSYQSACARNENNRFAQRTHTKIEHLAGGHAVEYGERRRVLCCGRDG